VLWLLTLGFVLEFAGLVTAARGLLETWQAHPHGHQLLPPRLHAAWQWAQVKLLRRRQSVRAHAGVATGTVSSHGWATGTATEEPQPGWTLDERMAVLERRVAGVLGQVSEVRAGLEEETRARAAEISRLDFERDALRDQLEAQDREIQVEGIPRAFRGLVLAATGLAVQGVASIAMAW
jgi:hypothetical protein